MEEQTPILSVVGLERSFGGIQAVRGAEFDVQKGSITALIGPNGAGKSTVVNLIAGALSPDSGHVFFEDREITGRKPFQVARAGLIRTFQISREYPALTVLENLMVSPPNQVGERLFTAMFLRGRYKQQERDLVAKALLILDDFGLYAMRNEYARNLSGGQKRLLELARAVMADPMMLILDEPMAGINPALISRIGEHMLRLKEERGYTFLMVEHNLDVVERICDHVVVLAVGRTLARGTMAELRMDSEVVSAYLTGGIVDASSKG
jgi:ABC-type branched-subunit amino acid transport system ATPase component